MNHNNPATAHQPTATPYVAAPTRYDRADRIYRRLGNSGILVPRIALGFWKGFGGVNDLAESRAMVHEAFDQGITYFDLANNYGPPYGSAEATLGELMTTSLAPYRDELFIATKAGYDMWPGPYGNWGSRKYLLSSLEASLRRMKLDCVDLFYSHRYDPNTPLDETLQALVDAVRQGKTRYVGISRWPLSALQYAVSYLRERDVPLLTYQGRYNLLDRTHESDGVLAYTAAERIGFVAFSPLAQGLLAGRYLNGIPADSRMRHSVTLNEAMLTPELHAQLLQWSKEAEAMGLSLPQYALHWVLTHEEVSSVIIGVSRMAQLKENLKLLDWC